jgi:hypothetical protein
MVSTGRSSNAGIVGAAIGTFVLACLVQLFFTWVGMIFLMWAHEADPRVPNLGFAATLFTGAALRILINSVSTSKD